jgi:predicted ATP-dependent endonuclease of OLD family
MRLQKIDIEGFRRIRKATILIGDATFLIGENNVGKSTVLEAIKIFFSTNHNKLHEQDYFYDESTDFRHDEVIFTAKFVDLPDEANDWRGFTGRIFRETINNNACNVIYYKKTFKIGENVIREMKSMAKSQKTEFSTCKTINDFITAGIDEGVMTEVFGDLSKTSNLSAKHKEKLELISDIWNIDSENSNWVTNPGGIEGNISSRLPKYIQIHPNDNINEINSKSGALQKIMSDLFEDVRETSTNFKEAQRYLNLLSAELDPSNPDEEFGKMMDEVNTIVGDIFKETKLHVTTDLTNPQTAIQPSFNVEMSSNVRTTPDRQGSGLIRSAVFALLRYREKFLEERKEKTTFQRTLIIGFEEPELYLHPNAASLMRDKIYELATSSHTKIVCTTHSPYLIDLSKKIDSPDRPSQILNSVKLDKDGEGYLCTHVNAFNTTSAYNELLDDEKDFVKYIIKMDDYVSRVFFAKKVIIVEGDTEDILFRETIKRFPSKVRISFLSDYQVIKARGKAAIIPLVKYFNKLGIKPFVVHDKDDK